MLRVLGVASAAMIVLAACGGAAAPAATSAPTLAAGPAAAATAAASEVTVQGFKFGPQSLEVKVGTTVTWTNMDRSGHTTTSGAPGAKDGKWDGELAASTGTFSFTFAQAGTFTYFCSRHPTSMTGTVVVK